MAPLFPSVQFDNKVKTTKLNLKYKIKVDRKDHICEYILNFAINVNMKQIKNVEKVTVRYYASYHRVQQMAQDSIKYSEYFLPEVESEGGPRQNPNSVSHHGHFM